MGEARRRLATASLQSDELDRVLDLDRRFFDRHCERTTRIRLAARAEVESLAYAYDAAALRPPHGERWYAVVRQIAPGKWLKAYITAPEGEDTDVPERWAAILFDRLQARAPEQFDAMREAVQAIPNEPEASQ